MINAVEEGRAEHEPGGHVLAGHRQQARLDLLGVQGGVVIDPIGIGLQHRAIIGWQGGVVLRRHGLVHFQQPHQIVRHRPLGALDARQLAARGQRRVLDGREIVLAMCEAQSEGHVRIGGAADVRHAVVVALDAGMIARRLSDQGRARRRRRLAQPILSDYRRQADKHQCRQRSRADLQISHEAYSPDVIARACDFCCGPCGPPYQSEQAYSSNDLISSNIASRACGFSNSMMILPAPFTF